MLRYVVTYCCIPLCTKALFPLAMQEKVNGKSKKWRLWRSSSGDLGTSWKGFKGKFRADSEGSDSSPRTDAFTAAMAAVVRAPPKDFRVVRQEWAAIRIQTAFRGFLVNLNSFLDPFFFSPRFLRK